MQKTDIKLVMSSTNQKFNNNKRTHGPQARNPLSSKKQARIQPEPASLSYSPPAIPASKVSLPGPVKDPVSNKFTSNMTLIMCNPKPLQAHPEQSECPNGDQQCWDAGDPSEHQSVFHTNQRDGVLICDNFLLGKCQQGSLCPHHHTPQPYHWQVRVKTARQWVSLGDCEAEHLERLYCNMEDCATLRNSNGFSCVLNLDTFKLTSKWIYDKVRRLSNTSDPKVNPYFPVQWSVYWKDGKCWKKYEKPISLELEGAFQKGMWNHAFQIQKRIYNADLKEFTQTNIKTNYKRGLRRRPAFRTQMQLVPYISTTASREHVVHGICPPGAVPVASSEADFARISNSFHGTLPTTTTSVCTIYRLHNKWLLQKYRSQKLFMSQGLTAAERRQLEKELYHGTEEHHLNHICKMNFDPRVAGEHGTCYGQGSYFARDASYSHNYTKCGQSGYRYMFLAKVLVGKAALGASSYRRPPALESTEAALYDSCVDNLKQPKIFVVFDSCQCYPNFLICYKILSDPVSVDE